MENKVQRNYFRKHGNTISHLKDSPCPQEKQLCSRIKSFTQGYVSHFELHFQNLKSRTNKK